MSCFLFILVLQDPHESDSDKDTNSEELPGEEMCETHQEKEPEPKVSITEATMQTTARIHKDVDLGQSHVSSLTTDQANRCQKQDARTEQLSDVSTGFAYSCAYSPELNRYLWDPSVSNGLFHSSRLNTWHSCANVDRVVPCGLSPALTPLPINQQHAMAQVHSNTKHNLKAISNDFCITLKKSIRAPIAFKCLSKWGIKAHMMRRRT